MHAARPAQLLPSDLLLCPKCGKPIPRVAIGEGALVVTCTNKLAAKPGSAFRDSCNQASYVIGHDYGAATVMPVTRAESELLRPNGQTLEPRLALSVLGVLRVRSAADVPSQECLRCDTLTKRYDLYAGVCRTCRDGGR